MRNLFAAALLLLCSPAFAQDPLREIDISSFYQPGKELVVNKIAWDEGRIIIQYSSPRAQSLEVSMVSYESFSSRKPEAEAKISAICEGDDCRFDINVSEFPPDLIHIMRFTDINTGEMYLEEIRPASEKVVPVIVTNAFDDILLDRAFLKQTEVYVKSLESDGDIYVFHYSEEFQPADPPSGIRNLPPKSLRPTRQFKVGNGERLPLDQTGLYFLQSDPSSNDGYSFRVEEAPYPSYNSLDDLKSCMIYISTREEWEKLEGGADKTEFDQIWLEAGGNENNARTAIRHYYRNVKLANSLFTSFKEGWKTDKGIIYTVFGAPKKVTLDYDKENWEYEINYGGKPLMFTFESRVNFFSPYHSTLERKKEYSGIWHSTIEKLRKGVDF